MGAHSSLEIVEDSVRAVEQSFLKTRDEDNALASRVDGFLGRELNITRAHELVGERLAAISARLRIARKLIAKIYPPLPTPSTIPGYSQLLSFLVGSQALAFEKKKHLKHTQDACI